MDDLTQMTQVPFHTHDGINTPRINPIQPKIDNAAASTADNTRAINEIISALEKLKLIKPNATP